MKPLLIAMATLLAVLPAAAQSPQGIPSPPASPTGQGTEGPDVVLTNPEDTDFYYVVDPPELEGFDPSGSVFPTVVYDYFSTTKNGPTRFDPLPAGGTVRLQGLEEGTHLLVGFFMTPGRREFPVRAIRLQVGEGLSERYYSVYTRPALVSVRAGRGRLADYPALPPRLPKPEEPAPPGAAGESAAPRVSTAPPAATAPATTAPAASTAVPAGPAAEGGGRMAAPAPPAGFFRFRMDNRYDDWDAIPPLAVFPADFQPGSFSRERFGRPMEVLALSQARHWRQGGTALSEMKIVRDERGIYLYVSTQEAISENLSLFLYLQSRAGGTQENRLTLELVPQTPTSPGLVVLWEKDEEPVVVGRAASGTFFLEAEVLNEVLLPYLESVPELSYFDLTSCYFDRGQLFYEEFYFASPSFSEIPTPQSLF